MKLLSVNVAMPREITHRGRTAMSGIFKVPLTGRATLHEFNIEGDSQADLEAHGGTHKAAYAYTCENYAFWEAELGGDALADGLFGENLTVEGMTDETVHIGDVFRVGDAVVEVTQPRVPCWKLGARMEIDGFEKRFLGALRLGFYLRVVEEGEIGAGDTIKLVSADPVEMSVRDVAYLLYFDRKNMVGAHRALAVDALSPGWRGSFEERLSRAGA